jgi:hypothetical protein
MAQQPEVVVSARQMGEALTRALAHGERSFAVGRLPAEQRNLLGLAGAYLPFNLSLAGKGRWSVRTEDVLGANAGQDADARLDLSDAAMAHAVLVALTLERSGDPGPSAMAVKWTRLVLSPSRGWVLQDASTRLFFLREPYSVVAHLHAPEVADELDERLAVARALNHVLTLPAPVGAQERA